MLGVQTGRLLQEWNCSLLQRTLNYDFWLKQIWKPTTEMSQGIELLGSSG